MKRRTFLKLMAAFPFAWLLYSNPVQAEPAEPYDSSMGQWVFDGVNGLTFPANSTVGKAKVNAINVGNFRALTFLERLLGGMK